MDNGLASRGYVICSEHRSGSTLLCQMLQSTGKLGYPDEVFRDSMGSLNVERDPKALSRILREATTPNGVYGLKVFSQQFDVTVKSRWTVRLPRLQYIFLERHDVLAQAISYVRALQTGQYTASAGATQECYYDRKLIAKHLSRITLGYDRWKMFFARNGITPLWVTYAELMEDPQKVVERVADQMELNSVPCINTSLITVSLQRDDLSLQWQKRFVNEMRDFGYLDNRQGKGRILLRRLARDVRFRFRLR